MPQRAMPSHDYVNAQLKSFADKYNLEKINQERNQIEKDTADFLQKIAASLSKMGLKPENPQPNNQDAPTKKQETIRTYKKDDSLESIRETQDNIASKHNAITQAIDAVNSERTSIINSISTLDKERHELDGKLNDLTKSMNDLQMNSKILKGEAKEDDAYLAEMKKLENAMKDIENKIDKIDTKIKDLEKISEQIDHKAIELSGKLDEVIKDAESVHESRSQFLKEPAATSKSEMKFPDTSSAPSQQSKQSEQALLSKYDSANNGGAGKAEADTNTSDLSNKTSPTPLSDHPEPSKT